MKKVLAAVAAALAACMLFVFIGCDSEGSGGTADSVDGKTYTYERCEATGENAEMIEMSRDKMYDGATISFADGKLTMTAQGQSNSIGYTQDGDTIAAEGIAETGTTIKVSGGSIVMETSASGVTVKLYFTL